MDKGQTYTCSCCHRTYASGWSNAEAVAEYEEKYGKKMGEEPTTIVCDCCNPIVEAAIAGASKEELRRMLLVRKAQIELEDAETGAVN